jgi:hypothetical protein
MTWEIQDMIDTLVIENQTRLLQESMK